MEEPNVTASGIITFTEKLESASSRFYEKLAARYKEGKETFLSFVKESKRTKVMVARTYQETISDALEACFSFEGLNLNDYLIKMTLTEDMSYFDALKMAIELEAKAVSFYSDVAECAKSLLATIAMAFGKAAETRKKRKQKLKSLRESFED